MLLTGAAVSLTPGAGIVHAEQVLYKGESCQLELSLGFNRCPQNKADVLGLAQNCAIVNKNSLGLSKDLLVTLQSKPDTASPLYGLFSIPGL